MPRKCPFKALFYGACKGVGLEIITPIRGRKQSKRRAMDLQHILFRNNNPDKGTETIDQYINLEKSVEFRNNNPDKGTETF